MSKALESADESSGMMRLPSVKGAIVGSSTSRQSSPTGGIQVINMDGAKRTNKKIEKRSPRVRGQSVNTDGKKELTADEALKLYFDNMAALELKLKNDMELMRRRRQGLVVSKKASEEESASQELT